MGEMNITIPGHVCIDRNVSEHVSYIAPGSPAMYMARVYRQFSGVATRIIAPYGHDFVRYLTDISIYPSTPNEERTLVYMNESRGAIRTQRALNREYAELLPITDELQKIIEASDIIFLAPLTPEYSVGYVATLMEFARKDCLKILLPQGYYRSFDSHNNVHQREFHEADMLLPLFDFVIVSEQDHFVIKEFAKEWANNIQVIVTRGEKGAHYYFHDESVNVDTVPVKTEDIVDSVGSGDIFSAAFGYHYYKSRNVTQSLEFANNIARQCLFYKADSLKIVLP